MVETGAVSTASRPGRVCCRRKTIEVKIGCCLATAAESINQCKNVWFNRERRSVAKMDAWVSKKKKIGCGEAACPWMAKRSRRTAQISISRLFSNQCRATHRTTLTGNREAHHDSAVVLLRQSCYVRSIRRVPTMSRQLVLSAVASPEKDRCLCWAWQGPMIRQRQGKGVQRSESRRKAPQTRRSALGASPGAGLGFQLPEMPK